MKILKAIVLLLLITTVSYAQKFKKYPFKSGKVEYVLEGNTKGKQIVQWNDYGYNEITTEESESNMFGQKTITNKTVLTLGTNIYEWSNADNKLYQTTNPIAETWEEGNYSDDDIEEFGIKTIEALGFEKIGTETLLGKNCDVYKGSGKIWVWKGLSLKTEVKLLGTKSLITATSVKTDINIPSSLFKLPSDRELVNNADIEKQIEEETDEAVDIKAEDVKNALKSLFGGDN